MSMRYLLRRSDPLNLDEIRSKVPDLDEQLGDPTKMTGPTETLHRPIKFHYSPQAKHFVYVF